jgi:hypothetical protein
MGSPGKKYTLYYLVVRDLWLIYYQPFKVCNCTLQSEVEIITITVIFIEFRVYVDPYYDMT